MAFLNPIFLLGALAAAVPVLVHLVRRTRSRRVPFASLMFLRRIEQKTIRKRKLRNLLLLAMRCAALLLLALAFSRPYFGGNPANAAADAPSSVILLDTSYSMQYPGVFERARQAAQRILDNGATDEQVALVSFASGSEVLRALKADVAEATAVLGQARPGLGGTDYLQALQTAAAMLRSAGRGARRVYLVSDFQEVGWERGAERVRLPADVKLIPVDVSDPSAANLAASEVRAEPVIYTQKYTGKILARVTSYTSDATHSEPVNAVVELKLNDMTVERRELELEAGSSQVLEFSGINVPEGSNRATVEIAGDRFDLDNKYHFTIKREDQIKVLAMETATRGRSETFFVQQSLLAGETSPYALTVKTQGTVDPAEVASYRAVILNDVAGIAPSVTSALKSFAEAGGGLIIAVGRHTDSSDFNRRMGEISPAQLSEVALGRGGYALMTQARTDHPVFSAFAAGGRLATAKVYGYHRATPGERASVVAALDDGSPLIIDGLVGKGKVILLTTTLDTTWSDLPLTPIFLPLLHQMLQYLCGADLGSSCLVGQSFTVRRGQDGALPAVDSPGGHRESGTPDERGDLAVAATEAGSYRLRYGSRSDYVAVNLDTKESNLARLDPDEFLASVAGGDEGKPALASQTEPVTPDEIERRQRLWLPLLALSLALFIGEAVLARRIRLAKVIG